MVSERDRDKLVAFVHGELDQLEVLRLTARFRTEEDLRLEYEALLATSDALEDLFLKPAPDELSHEQITHLLTRAKGPTPARNRRFLYAAGSTAVAAGLAAILWIQQDLQQGLDEQTGVSARQMITDTAQPATKRANESALAAPAEREAGAESEVKMEARGAPPAASVAKKESMQGSAGSIEAAKPDVDDTDSANAIHAEPPAAPPSSVASNLTHRKSEAGPTHTHARTRTRADDLRAEGRADSLDFAADSSAEVSQTAQLAETPVGEAKPAPTAKLTEVGAGANNEPQQWFACRTSNDCILVADACVWRAINKKFKEDFKKSVRLKPTQCATPSTGPALKAKYRPVCLRLKCTRADR